MKLTKSKLAIVLSKLKDFDKNILQLEQYSTPSEIAADIVWKAYMKGDVEGKIILDAACGSGYFGIGCLLLGSKKVYFVDVDETAINILEDNLDLIKLKFKGVEKKAVIKKMDISSFNEKVDTVLQNPPFGVKKEHADRVFLEKAFSVAKKVYSLHKVESKAFIEAIARDFSFEIKEYLEYDFMLKQTQIFHKKRRCYIKVGCWVLSRL